MNYLDKKQALLAEVDALTGKLDELGLEGLEERAAAETARSLRHRAAVSTLALIRQKRRELNRLNEEFHADRRDWLRQALAVLTGLDASGVDITPEGRALLATVNQVRSASLAAE